MNIKRVKRFVWLVLNSDVPDLIEFVLSFFVFAIVILMIGYGLMVWFNMEAKVIANEDVVGGLLALGLIGSFAAGIPLFIFWLISLIIKWLKGKWQESGYSI